MRPVTGCAALVMGALAVLFLLFVIFPSAPDGYGPLGLVFAIPCALISLYLFYRYFDMGQAVENTPYPNRSKLNPKRKSRR